MYNDPGQSDSASNPYASPPPMPAMQQQAPGGNTKPVGITMTVAGVIGLVGLIVHFTANIFLALFEPGAFDPPPGAEGAAVTGHYTGVVMSIVILTVALLAQVLIIAGGAAMIKKKGFRLAMSAAIAAVIPCISPCCMLGIPVGIWAIVVLSRGEVRRTFS